MASFVPFGGDQEQEEAGCGTPGRKLLKTPAQEDAKLDGAFGSPLAGMVEAIQKEQIEALRQELQAQQEACIASLEGRLTQRAAEEREELNSVLAQWYAQSVETQQEQGEVIDQLRCQAASGAHPGAGAEEAPDTGAGKAAAAAQEAVQALREELLALRAEDMQALQEAIAGISEEMSMHLQTDRGGKGAAGGEDQGAIPERLESLETACTELAVLSQQHHDLIHEVKSGSDQAQADLGRLAAERAEPQGGCSAGEAQAPSQSAALLAGPVLERLAAVEEAVASPRSQPAEARADTEALAAALEAVRARAEGDVSHLAQEVETSKAAIRESQAAADRAQGGLGNLAEEMAALSLCLQARVVEEGQTPEAEVAGDIGARVGKLEAIAGSGAAEADREQVQAWTMEVFHKASGHLSQRVRDLEDGLPGLKCTVAEVQGLALSADSGLRDILAESTRHGLQAQTLAKQIAGLEGSLFDRAKQGQAGAAKEQAPRDTSEELLRRVQTLEEKVSAPTSPVMANGSSQIGAPPPQDGGLGQGAAVTAERAKELAAEVMQDLSQELQAMHRGEMTHVLTAVEELRSEVAKAGIAMDLQVATNSALEAVRQISDLAEPQPDGSARLGACGDAPPSRPLEDRVQWDDLSVAGSTTSAANDALPPPPRTTLSATQVAALAPVRAGARGEAPEQQPAPRERPQGLVTAPGRTGPAQEAWSLAAGAQPLVGKSPHVSGVSTCVGQLRMNTGNGAAAPASTSHCSHRGSLMPGIARVASSVAALAAPQARRAASPQPAMNPLRSPSANSRAPACTQLSRPGSPPRRVVVGPPQVGPPPALVRAPSGHGGASHGQLVVAPPAPMPAWANGAAPAGGQPGQLLIPPAQLFAHQAGRA